MRKLCILLSFALATISVNAQSNLFEGGLLLGGSAMGGDLVRSTFGSISDVNVAYGIMLRRYFHTNIGVQLTAINTKLTSNDLEYGESGQQSVHSETPLTEISISAVYDILGHRRSWHKSTGGVSPYVFLGVGAALTDPKTTFGYTNEQVVADQNAEVSKTRIVVPFGAGIRWHVSKQYSLALEMGVRPTFSDYLDGVSLAGNPDKNDWYGFGSFQLWYKFGGEQIGN